MSKRNYKIFIKDIWDCINKIEQFVGNLDFDSFIEDEKTSSAVIRKLEIMGEAAKNIPFSIRQKYPKVDWKDMAGLRDKLIHDYFGIDFEILWKVIKEEIPAIKPFIAQILKEID